MTNYSDVILMIFLLTNLLLATSSRLSHCIKVVAAQGLLLGILPLVIAPCGRWPDWEQMMVAVLNLGIKGVALPLLLRLAMRRARVKRELEPLVGYSLSLGTVFLGTALGFWFCAQLHFSDQSPARFATPVALSTMLTGLFIIIARRKAITQTIGFLVFENGITVFGVGLMLEYGLLVELGILLDVFVLVFVMGIAVFAIAREFQHIDSDRLNKLGDWSNPE